ncbi:MAG: hypothetical protein ACD_75C01517G0002, partial [uncultured bacterium]
MKILLIAEYREGKLLGSINELLGFAANLAADTAVFLVGDKQNLPKFAGRLYLAGVEKHLEYNPDGHNALLLKVVEKEQPDLIVFSHSSYGWDLAPRLAYALKVSQISEVVAMGDGGFVVPACNAKLRRQVKSLSARTVLTLQAGAFPALENCEILPEVIDIDTDSSSRQSFAGYEAAAKGGVDLTKAAVIVSAGRGIGKPENIAMIADLAQALGGEYGASRPVVDAEWVEH